MDEAAATTASPAPRPTTDAPRAAECTVVTLVFFWSGAPGVLGACAAWRAGITRDAEPLGGAARIAGLVGVFIAGLNIVLTLGGFALTAIRS